MFTVEKIDYRFHKEASSSKSVDECKSIMNTIYKENPSYWPYGLDMSALDGGVYMIREASTRKPVGFTGWQERIEDNIKVGYYSIGILPEYRNNGFAKKAVSKLIALKAASVDQVKALVMKHNAPSIALADSINVPVVKAGSLPLKETARVVEALKPMDYLKMLGGGGAAAAFMDSMTYGRDKSWEEYKNTPFTTSRAVQAIANLGFGGAAASPKFNLSEKLLALGAIPGKDVALNAIPAIPSITDSAKTLAESSKKPSGLLESINSLSPTQKTIGAGAGIAGLLGAALLGYKGISAANRLAASQEARAGGRIRVALPTKDPGDTETTVELPMGDLAVSNTQLAKLQRDLRRRVRSESKERTHSRNISNLIEPADDKSASIKNIKSLLKVIYG